MTAQMEATMSTIPLNPKAATQAISHSTKTRKEIAMFTPLDPQNTAIVFIDYQDGILELSRTVETANLRAAAVRLAKLTRLCDIPVVVSTAMLESPSRVTSEIVEALGKLDHHVSGRTTA